MDCRERSRNECWIYAKVEKREEQRGVKRSEEKRNWGRMRQK